MSELERVQKLAKLLVEKQAVVKRLDDELKAHKKELLSLEREDLPALMEELGLKDFTLSTGEKIAVVKDVEAAITEKTRYGALRWLLANNFGGLIKTVVSIEFGRGDRNKAEAVREEIAAHYDDVELLEKVHPSTLKAFVKERMAAGEPVPADLFNVRPFSKAKIN